MWGESTYVSPNMRLDERAVERLVTLNRTLLHRDSPLQGFPPGDSRREAVMEALEAFRMAATNVPRDDAAIDKTFAHLTKQALEEVPGLPRFFNRMCDQERESRQRIGRPVTDPFDASQMDKMHLVANGIYVGSYHPACDRELLRAHGITHVLTCIEMPPKFPTDFVYTVLTADDRAGYDITQHFNKTHRFIDQALCNGGGVLIHCGAGISRAPTVAAAYLVRKFGVSAEEAIRSIRRVRACVMPNVGFKAQLNEFADKVRKGTWKDDGPSPIMTPTQADGASAESRRRDDDDIEWLEGADLGTTAAA
uniref:Protein-serine/threonine phosphatase n=1 Tax=Neobodo designis TaxID=312471 RepID=A0A7S1R8C1_NEODS|mmetsp:Transcript_9815/g.30294  ORF Transcript_9815/g.30294 Transcript_9815/m.30294 type:complete len:308 (+) Transcript_9815:204-1127(+)|eukprot:CAMPEP_0174851014 /NCGR_PEP_ID=MMETSP1114-20130205/21258_1 /TAXON_ID=312471 /ORGANISM="Neobodo designis, Strain CCAP 1951/1" /LENGTH=307 /DNA_ID=CAMNT_0016085511 /DNA_START=202 /DNA_END=1125 /DNA_ORIENTATION=+